MTTDRSTLLRRDRRVGHHRPHHARVGIIALALLIAAVVVGVNRGIPGWPSGKDEVWAQFSSAQSLKTGNPVRVAGVNVGKVGEIKQADSGRGALVRLDLDRDKVKLHDDARAGIYWRTLLGRNLYVELDPGSSSAPGLGGRIDAKHTTVQVDLDEVLQPLQADVRKGAQQVIAGLDGGLDGSAAGDAFDVLAATAKPIAQGLPALRGQAPGDLTRLIANTARWTRALHVRQGELAGLIDNSNTTLAVTAARSADIGATFDALPGAMRQTRGTLAGLTQTLPLLDQTASQLRPGARNLERAADTTRPLLVAAAPLLRRARPLLDRLDPALRGLKRLAPDLTATMSGLREPIATTKQKVIPFLQSRNKALDMKVYELIGPTLASSTGVMATSDANGTFVQFEAGAGEAAVPALPCKTLLTDPTDTRVAICQDVKTYLASILTPMGQQPEFGKEDDQSKDPNGGRR
jgi:virulence factor Mce-like protein